MKKTLKKIHVFGEHTKETQRNSMFPFKIRRKRKETQCFQYKYAENVKKIDVFGENLKKTYGKSMFSVRIHRKHNENLCPR